MKQFLAFIPVLALLGRAPEAPTDMRREELMTALRSGGYTILLRHARTDRSYNEQRDPVPVERSQQRNLTDDGVRDARLMGVVFRKYRVPLGEIISSPMYRTLETAELAAGKPTMVTMALRVFPSTPEQAALVATPPRPGTNRLLVTHHFVIETHVPGINPGDIGESEAAVVRHTNDGKVELVGRILLDDWAALADSTPAAVASQGNNNGIHDTLARVFHGSSAAHGAKTAEIPDTHAGHIAREYIAAFNSGSADTMKTFIESWMVADPTRPMADRLGTYAKLFAEHGAMTVTSVQESQSLVVTLGMKSKAGDFRLTVKSSEAEPMRATSVTFALLRHR